MNKLDSIEEIRKHDEKGVLSSINMLPQQAQQAWDEIDKLEVDKSLWNAKNIVICGMGGSALGGRVTDSLIEKKIRAPIEIFTQYYVPNYVNKDTLVILSSYSGNTEEVLSCAYDALKRKAKIFGIFTGGKLKELFEKEKLNHYCFDPEYNPSKMPRLAIGYSIFSILAILNKLQFITLSDDEFKNAIQTMQQFLKEFGPRAKKQENLAKQMADELQGKVPVIVAAEHVVGISYVFKNQLNETAKTYSNLFDLPELNHHLLEGLKQPPKSKELLKFVFIESDLYTERVIKRFVITEEVVDKNSVPLIKYRLRSRSKIEQVIEMLCLSSYISFYLAVLTDVDPSVIPWVDYFKEKLSS